MAIGNRSRYSNKLLEVGFVIKLRKYSTYSENRWFMLVMSRLDRPGSLLEFGSLFKMPELENRGIFGRIDEMDVCRLCRENLETWRSREMEKEIAGMKRLGSFL